MRHTFTDTVGHCPTRHDGGVRRAFRCLRQILSRIDATLALWHFRARSRRELEGLDDRLLRDIGVDRCEARKPFWRE